MTNELLRERDRLRAENAEKDAEILLLRGENAMLAMIVKATLEASLEVEAELDKVKGGA